MVYIHHTINQSVLTSSSSFVRFQESIHPDNGKEDQSYQNKHHFIIGRNFVYWFSRRKRSTITNNRLNFLQPVVILMQTRYKPMVVIHIITTYRCRSWEVTICQYVAVCQDVIDPIPHWYFVFHPQGADGRFFSIIFYIAYLWGDVNHLTSSLYRLHDVK